MPWLLEVDTESGDHYNHGLFKEKLEGEEMGKWLLEHHPCEFEEWGGEKHCYAYPTWTFLEDPK